MKLYRINRWNEHFENNRSRQISDLRWVSLPNKHDGEHYSLVMTDPNAAIIYSAWVLMVQVASKCHPRGSLVRDNGRPHTPASLALKTRAPAAWFEAAIGFLIERTDWLTVEETSGECHPTDAGVTPKCHPTDAGVTPDVDNVANEDVAGEHHPTDVGVTPKCHPTDVEAPPEGREGKGIEGKGKNTHPLTPSKGEETENDHGACMTDKPNGNGQHDQPAAKPRQPNAHVIALEAHACFPHPPRQADARVIAQAAELLQSYTADQLRTVFRWAKERGPYKPRSAVALTLPGKFQQWLNEAMKAQAQEPKIVMNPDGTWIDKRGCAV